VAGAWQVVRDRNEKRCERILEGADPMDGSDVDWARVASHDLDAVAIGCLVYMRDVESFVDRELVGLPGHPNTVGDPLIGRFLDRWRAEEHGHATVLARFLDTYAADRDVAVPARPPTPPAEPTRMERALVHIGGPIADTVTASHMAWGAANELLTLNGYRILARRCDHPLLAELLNRIADQEARHYSFYLLQAEWRLAASRTARAVVPRLMRNSWTPVGVGDDFKRPEEFEQVMLHLARGDDAAVVERMDNRFSRLPGLEALRIFGDVLARATGSPEATVA
jgi:rubrerythrin